MTSRLLAIALFLSISGATLLGQDFTGTWQGTVGIPAAPRIVLKIARAADGKLEGQLFSIDQGAQPRTMSLLTVDGRVVKWKVDGLNANYEGTFSPDGNTISGAITPAAGAPQPLNFVRATPQTAWTIPEATAPPQPWTRQSIPASRWRR